MENCLNCAELMFDGFTWYCHCNSCPYFDPIMKPIMYGENYNNGLPERIEFEEGDEEDVFFI